MPIGIGLIIPGAIAPAGAPTIDVDAVDKAAASLPGLLSYMRPKRVTDPNALFKDRMGLTISPQATGIVKSAADAQFNAHGSFDYSPVTGGNWAHEIQTQAPASFTFAAVIRVAAWKAVGNFYGDTAGFVSYFNGTGQFQIDTDWTTNPTNESGAKVTNVALNDTCVFWLSYDAATKTARWGRNSAVATGSVVLTKNRQSTVGKVPHPLGFFTNSPGTVLGGKIGFWALSNIAMGTGVGSADVPLTNFVAAAKTYYAIP